MRRNSTAAASRWLFLLLQLLACSYVAAQTPPSGFGSTLVSNQWNEVVGLTFTNDGVDMFVWERGGRDSDLGGRGGRKVREKALPYAPDDPHATHDPYFAGGVVA